MRLAYDQLEGLCAADLPVALRATFDQMTAAWSALLVRRLQAVPRLQATREVVLTLMALYDEVCQALRPAGHPNGARVPQDGEA